MQREERPRIVVSSLVVLIHKSRVRSEELIAAGRNVFDRKTTINVGAGGIDLVIRAGVFWYENDASGFQGIAVGSGHNPTCDRTRGRDRIVADLIGARNRTLCQRCHSYGDYFKYKYSGPHRNLLMLL